MFKNTEHFIEKLKSLFLISRKINQKLSADSTYSINLKTFGQKLRKKRMNLGLQLKELAQFIDVTDGTVINWELRNVKPPKESLKKGKNFSELSFKWFNQYLFGYILDDSIRKLTYS